MKVKVAESFFESLKDCFGIKGWFNRLRGWFHYHFRRDFWKVMKTAFDGYPYDHSYLLQLERSKIVEMANYIEKAARYEGYEKDVKWMRIAVKLLDILIDDGLDLFHYDGEVKYIPLNNGNYEVDTSELKYVCHIYVNTRNINRFYRNYEPIDYYKERQHHLYLRKVRYLYHKIRLYYEEQWWD